MWPGFDSRTWCHMWVEFVVGSRPCSEGFFLGTPVFLPSQKPTFPNSNSTWKQGREEPLRRVHWNSHSFLFIVICLDEKLGSNHTYNKNAVRDRKAIYSASVKFLKVFKIVLEVLELCVVRKWCKHSNVEYIWKLVQNIKLYDYEYVWIE